MRHSEHNGWTNYETWLVKLWWDNDERAEDYINRDLARRCVDVSELASELKTMLLQDGEDLGLPTTGVFADVFTSFIGEVNFDEIAAAYWQDKEDEEVSVQPTL